jgi:hypothetical protein
MKQEFKLLKNIIRDYAPTEYSYDPQGGDRKAKQADYDMVDVIPVSDPNSSTMAQRIMQYQAVMQLSQQAPQIYNLPLLHRQMIEVLGVKNADKLVPTDDDQTPIDPISENMGFLNGKPTKAFIFQDHDAHIAAHTTFLQDPMIAQTIGQNPMAQQMGAAVQAHISEHLAFAYRKKIEEQMGVPLPPPSQRLPEEVEVHLSQLVAQAATQLLQQNQAQAKQQQVQQMQQDPLVQMQQQELQIKQQEAATKAKKVEGDLMLKQAEIELKYQASGQQGEDPVIVAERHRAEMEMQAQRHAQEMAQAQQQQQLAAAQAQQGMQQAQQAHGQKMAHGGQVHGQKLRHAEMAAEQARQQPTAKPSGRKGE